jgi:hypothetical protein
MKTIRLILSMGLLAGLVAIVACSDSVASACEDASKAVEACNAKQSSDSGVSVTLTFDAKKCQDSGDQGKKAADCINANKDKCDCMAKCAVQGSCS